MKKKLNITDSGAIDIVTSMANSLDAKLLKHKAECVIELPKEFGNGLIKGYEFEDGLGVVDAHYCLLKDFHFHLEKGIVHPLKIIFNLGEVYYHKLENETDYRSLEFMETMIVASTSKNNHRFLIPAKNETSLFSLEINRELFKERVQNYFDILDPELEELFKDTYGILPFIYKSSISFEISKMIEEFRNCKSTGLTRNLYLEGKVYEIFASFIQLYLDGLRNKNIRKIFRHNHLKAVKDVAHYIKDNLNDRLNIADLAQSNGISSNILQNGFRTLYDMSVKEFVQKERLELTKKLLEESDLSISQITYTIGISSKSYISKLFFDRYGMTPSQYRKQFGKNLGSA